MNTDKDVWVAVPIYNHAAAVRNIVLEILDICPRVVVVDDGSTDANIAEILKDTSAIVAVHEKNLGKGAAIRTAARLAASKGGCCLITIDADGQHNPQDIKKFLSLMAKDGKNNIIVGRRDFSSSKNVSHLSLIGKKISDFFIRIETSVDAADSQSGFKAYPIRLLLETECLSSRFGYETEIIVRNLWAGYGILKVDVSVSYPQGRISHFRKVADVIRIVFLHICLLWEKFYRLTL